MHQRSNNFVYLEEVISCGVASFFYINKSFKTDLRDLANNSIFSNSGTLGHTNCHFSSFDRIYVTSKRMSIPYDTSFVSINYTVKSIIYKLYY